MPRVESNVAEMIYDELCRDIESGIYDHGDGIPSENVLAKKFDVSRFYARKALVQLEERGLVINRPGSGRVVARRKAGIKRLAIVDSHSQEFFEMHDQNMPEHVFGWQNGIMMACREHNVLPLYITRETKTLDERLQLIREALNSNIDAMIISMGYFIEGRERATLAKAVKECGTPYLFFNNFSTCEQTNFFDGDNYAVGKMVTEYLMECGHRQIGFIGEAMTMDFVYYRYRGIVDAITAAGLPMLQSAHYQYGVDFVNSYNWFESGRMGCESLITSGAINQLSAIICANDAVAGGAIEALNKHGVRVPDDISVIGFDNDPRLRHLNLTSGFFPFVEQSRKIGEDFIRQVQDDPDKFFFRYINPVLLPGTTVKNIV